MGDLKTLYFRRHMHTLEHLYFNAFVRKGVSNFLLTIIKRGN